MLTDDFLLAGPDFHFGSFEPILHSVDGGNESVQRLTKLVIFFVKRNIDQMRTVLGLSLSYMLMYQSTNWFASRVRRSYDQERGEDIFQCVLCTGAAFGRSVVVFAVVEYVTGGVLQLPPATEIGVLMVCFTFVDGSGRCEQHF